MLFDEKLDMSQQCTCNPESQPYLGLHQKQHGQEGKRGDSAPLLCFCETPLGALGAALEAPAQKEY